MKRTVTYILSALSFLTLSCKKESHTPAYVREPIEFSLEHSPTKATVFDGDDAIYKAANGGGAFSVFAYPDGDVSEYISNGWVEYFKDDNTWQCRHDMGTPDDLRDDRYIYYYWPKQQKLDFFAYMPYDQKPEDTGVTIGDYSATTGPSFSCELPLDNGQDNLQEFIYAYTIDQDKTTQGSDGVYMEFVHPFSAVRVKLIESYRMTIQSISFSNVISSGTYSNKYSTVDFGGDRNANFNYSCWHDLGTPAPMTLTINKDVPDDINFQTIIGGPYIVIPQSLDDIELSLTYKRDDALPVTHSFSISSSGVTAWEPGKRYTYNLSIGDPQEEILFNVLVEEWDVVDYKNEIDVE